MFIKKKKKKDDSKISRISEFGGEKLSNTENIALRSLQILCIFVSRAEKVTIFSAILAQKMVTFFRA